MTARELALEQQRRRLIEQRDLLRRHLELLTSKQPPSAEKTTDGCSTAATKPTTLPAETPPLVLDRKRRYSESSQSTISALEEGGEGEIHRNPSVRASGPVERTGLFSAAVGTVLFELRDSSIAKKSRKLSLHPRGCLCKISPRLTSRSSDSTVPTAPETR